MSLAPSKLYGGEGKSPYLLEFDFPVEDLLQKHKKEILRQFLIRRTQGEWSKNIKDVSECTPTLFRPLYDNSEFNRIITKLWLDIIDKNFIVSELTSPITMWSYVQNRDYQSCEVHNHITSNPKSSIIGTFYTDVPSQGGDFKYYLGGPGEFHTIKPEINKIYVFPSWLYHTPTPMNDMKSRICMSVEYCCDMRVRLKDLPDVSW